MIDPLALIRATHLAATVVAAGIIFFELAIARPLLGGRSASARRYFTTLNRWVWTGLVIAGLSGFAWALLIAMQISNGTALQAFTDSTLTTLLTDTRFGQVWLWRGAFLLTTMLSLLSASVPAAWCRLIVASAMLVAIACVGHSGARSDTIGWLQLGADMAHLLAAGLWLGGLPALAILLAGRSRANIDAVTRRFSSFAVAAVATLLASGLFNAYLLTDSIWSLPDSDYGRLLLMKTAAFAIMLIFAAINRFYWTQRLPDRLAVASIRRHSVIEAALGLLVLAIVGVLGTLPPPLHAHLHTAGDDDGTFVHIHDAAGMAEVRLRPGVPGQNSAEIRLMQEDFSPLKAKSVVLQLSQPGQLTTVIEATPIGEGLWQAPDLVLPVPGIWTIVVEIGRQDTPPLALDGPIVVNPGSSAKSAKSE